MAERLVQRHTITIRATIVLEENEMAALDALAGYGTDAFLTVFYEKLGRHYMEPHEAGLRSLFKSVRAEVPALLSRAEAARAALSTRAASAPTQESKE